jgi:hypothetical protein
MPIYRSTMARAFGLLITSLTLGCSTTIVDLRYERESGFAAAPSPGSGVTVGEFTDSRGTEPTHLGSIRSGIGNPMKRLVLEKPAGEIVARAFADGLRERGWLAESTSGSRTLVGRIEKLDCNQYSNREAHVTVRIRVVDPRSGREVFADLVESTLEQGGGLGGPFGSVEGLRALAERALQEVVDAALDDPRFRDAL